MNERETAARITVLSVPECPNVPRVRERIVFALAGRDVPVDLIEVSDEAGATRWGDDWLTHSHVIATAR
ncbi:hypothetical protein [Streptomyces sp. NBC_00996]|uniref:hypothetical protein n=1 Tax=Streptomyces sp. NBC_00996 TaxID=2903710 RepID=UPI00386AE599|nr:hypothetical protein OG390_03650 [Streptomyces sp. NBC_00996]